MHSSPSTQQGFTSHAAIGLMDSDPRILGEKLRSLIRLAGKTQAKIAEEIGADPTYVSQMVNGRVNWTESGYFRALTTALGLKVAEIKALKPDLILSDEKPAPPRDEVSAVLNVFKVPVICMASAGPGISPDAHQEPLAYDYVLPELYLEHMLIMQVDGDSMNTGGAVNSLDAGDWVYVDTHSLDLREGKIYVVYVPGSGVMVKRVRHYPALGWVLTSDNASYPPIQPENAKVIGRVYYRQPKGEKL